MDKMCQRYTKFSTIELDDMREKLDLRWQFPCRTHIQHDLHDLILSINVLLKSLRKAHPKLLMSSIDEIEMIIHCNAQPRNTCVKVEP